MVDLTTLEGKDTPGKVASLCQKALRPHNAPDTPQVAAVCVYPSMVKHAAKHVKGTPVRIASVATAFPSGQAPLKTRLAEVRQAVADGADEIDMVINRGAFLAGELTLVQDEISAVRDACGEATLKVILETSELETYDHIRAASFLAMRVIRPGDFIKTSTGKTSANATLGNNQVMLDAINRRSSSSSPSRKRLAMLGSTIAATASGHPPCSTTCSASSKPSAPGLIRHRGVFPRTRADISGV